MEAVEYQTRVRNGRSYDLNTVSLLDHTVKI
jgi:hypothetical protein